MCMLSGTAHWSEGEGMGELLLHRRGAPQMTAKETCDEHGYYSWEAQMQLA